MKTLFLLFTGLLLSLVLTSFADDDFHHYHFIQHPLNITIQFSEITSHNKKMTNAQCGFQVKGTYQVFTNKKTYSIGDDMEIKIKKVDVRSKHGIILLKGKAIWSGISVTNGQPFSNHAYFAAIGLKDAGEMQGVIRDQDCQATFTGRFTN